MKKLKILLVAAGLMGSLYFLNCYATEKQANNLENLEQGVEKEIKSVEIKKVDGKNF